MWSAFCKDCYDWPEILFVKNPRLFLPLLEREKDKADMETSGLLTILNKYDIEEGAKILDLSCGIGRHAVRLAKKGYEVVGYDPSPFFLNIAMQEAERLKSNFRYPITFYQGKPGDASGTLSKDKQTNFDVIISMWQSFGYTSITDDVAMFKDVRRIASHECLLIIDAQNRDHTIRNFQPTNVFEFKDLEIHEKWKFNLEKSLLENISKFYKRDSDGNLQILLTLPTIMILYSLHDMVDLLNNSGWNYITSYGSFRSLLPVDLDSERIITISNVT